jgi:ribonuclease E
MPLDGQPVEQMTNGHLPVEHAPYDATPPAAMDIAAAMPPIAPPPEPIVASAPQPVPMPAPEPVPTPAPVAIPVSIVPSISADAPPEKPKRGWWRR